MTAVRLPHELDAYVISNKRIDNVSLAYWTALAHAARFNGEEMSTPRMGPAHVLFID
jgi:hypothetical protein